MLARRAAKKGQIIAPDFIISVVIFMVLVVGSAIVWNHTVSKYSQFRHVQFMQGKAFSITDALIMSEGYPEEWNSTGVRLIGLSEGTPHILNQNKLLLFKNISGENYSFVKKTWGINGYEYYIRLTNASGSIVVLDGNALEYGNASLEYKSDLVPLRRLVLINQSGTLTGATMTFMIWR